MRNAVTGASGSAFTNCPTSIGPDMAKMFLFKGRSTLEDNYMKHYHWLVVVVVSLVIGTGTESLQAPGRRPRLDRF